MPIRTCFGGEEAEAQRAARTDPEGCRRQNLLIPVTFQLRPLIKACGLLCCPGKNEGWTTTRRGVCERLKEMTVEGRVDRQAGRPTDVQRQSKIDKQMLGECEERNS